jgi:hypothetical protein
LTNQEGRKSKDTMKAKFTERDIDLNWVSIFPHIDDFHGRDPGHSFLGCVSCTVDDDTYPGVGNKYQKRKWLTMTFCQRKVHEDTEIRETCVSHIHDGIRCWRQSLPEHCKDTELKKFVHDICKVNTD